MKISENDLDSLRDALSALVDAARKDERAGINAASCGKAGAYEERLKIIANLKGGK